MGVKNIIADDRLKLVKLLEEDKDYYDIVLSRVREINEPSAINNYYLYYKKGFTWPTSIGEEEFIHFFPFHKPALEVLRAISYELTTTRSAIHFMHQTLKHQIKHNGRELIRLWELFDEAVRYEEDPSGVHAGIVAIKTKKETEYRAYESCKRQIESLTKGPLKIHREKAIKIIQTLFLYHIAKTRQQGITPEEIANSILIERQSDSNPDENTQHYEFIADKLKTELRQVVQTYDEEKQPHYRFDPVFTGIDPRDEFRKARDEVESNEILVNEAWDQLIALDEWPIKTRQMTIDLSSGVNSIFRNVAPFIGHWEDLASARHGDQTIEINWNGRQISGLIGMRDLHRIVMDNTPLPPVDSDQTDWDFEIFIGKKSISKETISKLLNRRKDSRIILWIPDELSQEERDRLLDFAAFRKLISDWENKESEDAVAVINWVANTLQTELGKIKKIVDNSYARGRIDALNNSQMEFHVAGELSTILSPIIDRVLSSVYESSDIKFDPPFIFRKEEGVKVINGIVKSGHIPKGAKPNQNISAAQNFGFSLGIMKKSAEKELDTADNTYVQDIWKFIDDKLVDDGQTMKIETLYKNFMGIGGPKDYGLTRRMVHIYILCLVREGKIRLGIGSKSGIQFTNIDYSNISEIDFSARILDSLNEIQKLAKPENWEILRPFGEKLLGETIPITHDDAVISKYRAKLREFFLIEKEEAKRLELKAKSLFEILDKSNPYEIELNQMVKLFSADIEAGNDINLILFNLKEIFNYKAFDEGIVFQDEVDDFANRIKIYLDLRRFVSYENEIRTIHNYCSITLPEHEELEGVRTELKKISTRITELKDYIDSEVKLKTELIGKIPPAAGETGTLSRLIQEYSESYIVLHDQVINRASRARDTIKNILSSDDMNALETLEEISALQPAVYSELHKTLDEFSKKTFECPSPSQSSIKDQLQRNPQHECGLTFESATEILEEIDGWRDKSQKVFKNIIDKKFEIFLNPTVRQRLGQGKSEPIIAKILSLEDLDGVRNLLVKTALDDPNIVKIINRYLKKISIKRIHMNDFKPSIATIEDNQITQIVEEFKDFLKKQLEDMEKDDDTFPMLQVE